MVLAVLVCCLAAGAGHAAAQTKPGTYSIAQYFDQSPKAPKIIVASVLYNLQGINENLIKRALNNQLTAKQHLVYTLANLNVGTLVYNPLLSNVSTPAVRAKVDEISTKLKNGTIKPPPNEQIGEPGTGAKIDPKSLGC